MDKKIELLASRRKKIVDFLSANPMSRPKTISLFTNIPVGSIHPILENMFKEGLVQRKSVYQGSSQFLYFVKGIEPTPLNLIFDESKPSSSGVDKVFSTQSDKALLFLKDIAQNGNKDAVEALKEIALKGVNP